MLIHTVFFTLINGTSDEDKSAFIKQVEGLGAIETVDSMHVGTPAATPDRPVIHKNYDVGLTVLFKCIEDHDVYQVHQVHDDFIDNNKHLWANVVIYDAD